MTKPSSTQERCLFCPGSEILEQTSSTPSLGTLRVYLQKKVGPGLVGNIASRTNLTSFPLHFKIYLVVFLVYNTTLFKNIKIILIKYCLLR